MQADGIPILCFVSRPEEIACTCFVGSDDRALARGIADYLFDRLDGAGDVVTLEGHPNAITTAPRAAGFRDAARARESIRIVDSRPGYFLRDGGHAGMIQLLAAQPRIDGVLAANDLRRWVRSMPCARRGARYRSSGSTPRRKAQPSRQETCWPRHRSMP
jgi:ribose transport system substrate-binding protein